MKSTDSKRLHTSRKLSDKESIFGPEKTREQVLEEIMAEPDLYQEFQKLSPQPKKELVEFAMGVRGLNVTYDPVFKKMFDPETRRGRLEEFLSLCMKEKVRILRVMPNESQRLTEEGSLLVMDILVQLKSGALVNVEIQQSTAEFYQHPEDYLHYFQQTSNTGLKLDLLQKYLLIPLDIFLECLHNRRNSSLAVSRKTAAGGPGKQMSDSTKPPSRILHNKLEAWLTFIASDKPEDIMEVVRTYPKFREPYQEVFAFRYQQRELISMYSKALGILDANTVEYMVEQQRKEILELTKALGDKSKVLEETSKKLEAEHREVERLKSLLKTGQTFRSDF